MLLCLLKGIIQQWMDISKRWILSMSKKQSSESCWKPFCMGALKSDSLIRMDLGHGMSKPQQ